MAGEAPVPIGLEGGPGIGEPLGLARECCGECVQVCPTGALMEKTLLDDKGRRVNYEDKSVDTLCPYCGVGCQTTVHVKDDKILYVDGRDGPANENRLCVKGRFGFDYVHHPDRLTVPLVRRDGVAKDPKITLDRNSMMQVFREASWEEALALAGGKLRSIRDTHGSQALAGFGSAKGSNEEAYLFQKLVRVGFGSNNVDHCTRLCHAGSVVALQMAIGSSAMSNTAAEVMHSDVFIVTGSNTAETHPIIALQMKAAVANRGAKLIVVDPRRVEMVNWSALWLPEKPGTDVPLFSAMAHVIIAERLYNRDFIDRRTEGFEEFSRSMEKSSPMLPRSQPVSSFTVPTRADTAAPTIPRSMKCIVQG